LESEVRLLENYLSLQHLRYPEKFGYAIEVDEGIDPATLLVPPMLVQPFVEDAIEHGLKNIDYKGVIKISYSQHNQSIMVKVEDNGIGITKGMGNKKGLHESFATEATKARLKIINKKMKGKFCFEVFDKSGNDTTQTGTVVQFLIPYLTNDH
jgi:LytS/YehU family sensor histidine kinase